MVIGAFPMIFSRFWYHVYVCCVFVFWDIVTPFQVIKVGAQMREKDFLVLPVVMTRESIRARGFRRMNIFYGHFNLCFREFFIHKFYMSARKFRQ